MTENTFRKSADIQRHLPSANRESYKNFKSCFLYGPCKCDVTILNLFLTDKIWTNIWSRLAKFSIFGIREDSSQNDEISVFQCF